MDRYLTFHDKDLLVHLTQIYELIKESAESMAFSHISTIESDEHNPHHLDHFLENSNKAIKKLAEFFPVYDNRRELFEPLDKDLLIAETKRILESDLY